MQASPKCDAVLGGRHAKSATSRRARVYYLPSLAAKLEIAEMRSSVGLP